MRRARVMRSRAQVEVQREAKRLRQLRRQLDVAIEDGERDGYSAYMSLVETHLNDLAPQDA